LALTAPSLADTTIGGNARAIAMGGAGLASGDLPGESAANPASLASKGLRLGLEMPSFTASVQGADSGEAKSLLGSTTLDPSQVINMAMSLGKGPTVVEATASGGVLLPMLDVRASANIRAVVTPNDSFKNWANSGGLLSGMANDAQADVRAVGVATAPAVGVGFRLPAPGRMAVGLRLKPGNAYYSHYIVDKNSIDTRVPVLAPEMEGQQYLKRTSFSADIGVIYSPRIMKSLRLAVMVNNFIEPQPIKFNVISADGLMSRQVAPRTVSTGAAFVTKQLTVAADWSDLTGAYGDPDFRAGAELRLGAGTAIRGGYNQENGYTYGFGVGSFGVAFSEKAPISVADTVVF
jgi:hypothetical protein